MNPHQQVTKILGEHIGENMTSIRRPLPAQGIYIKVCPKCGNTRTVSKAKLYATHVCNGKDIV